jgi:carboxymethylenebutenolidase
MQAGTGEWVTIPTSHGEIRGYMVRPSGPPPWPALLIVHAVMGLDPYIQKLTAEFAADGYLALTPDIYTNDAGYKQHEPLHIEMAAHLGTDREKQKEGIEHCPAEIRSQISAARDWINDRPTTRYIDLIAATFNYLRGREDVRAIGTMGFCMGGRLVGELAVTGADLAAGIIYYGGPPKLEEVPNIRCPLEGHYASRDPGITRRIPALDEAMKAAGKDFTYYIYEAQHGFSLSPHTPSHDAAATKLSMGRVKAFLEKHLKPAKFRDAK